VVKLLNFPVVSQYLKVNAVALGILYILRLRQKKRRPSSPAHGGFPPLFTERGYPAAVKLGIPRATLINLWPDFSPQSALPYYFSRFPAENALFQSLSRNQPGFGKGSL
jgi:hypothetical protein